MLDMSVVLTVLFWSLRFARLGAIGCWTRPRGWPAAHDACYTCGTMSLIMRGTLIVKSSLLIMSPSGLIIEQ